MKKLKVLPPMGCEPHCGECCTIVPATETEFQRVRRYAEEHEVTPRAQGLTCPFYQGGGCAVHEVRPNICRVFGYLPQLVCGRGHNVTGVEDQAERMIRATGAPSRFLHELLGWTPEEVRDALADLRELALAASEAPEVSPGRYAVRLPPRLLAVLSKRQVP